MLTGLAEVCTTRVGKASKRSRAGEFGLYFQVAEPYKLSISV